MGLTASSSPVKHSEALILGHKRATAPESKALLRSLVWLYVLGSLAAAVVTLLLAWLGLEFTASQWWLLLLGTPFALAAYIGLDIYVIARHYRPIGLVLERISHGVDCPQKDINSALIHALNLPFYSFIRVTFIHGPAATATSTLILVVANIFFDAGFATWQVISFAATVLCFASPTHAILEYFSISRRIEPVTVHLWEAGASLDQAETPQLIGVKLREKLLYLSIFIAAVPLMFFAGSIVFKVELLLSQFGISATVEQMLPLWLWLGGVATICIISALVMSVLTASDVSRSAALLNVAMTEVEGGDLNKHLHVINTDEYASLYRGFNLMTASLREEAHFLEVTQDVAGELHLDALLERIMGAAMELLGAERSTVFAYDASTDELWSRFAEGVDTREIRFSAREGIAGVVFANAKTENIADPYNHPLFNPEIDRLTEFTTRNILCMPIVNKSGTCIGVTQVLNKIGGAFSTKDEARLAAFTAQIAVSLENAQLFEDVLNIKNYNEGILKSISNGIITLDSEHNVVTANDAAGSIIGISESARLHGPISRLLEDNNQWVLRSLAKVRDTGEPDISVDANLHLSHNQTDVSVNLTITPLVDATDQNMGSIMVLEDISSEKRVKTTMARYMSAEVVEQLLEQGESELGGKNQHVSVLFSDVRSFTTISETIGARETVSMLNEYFEVMVDVLFKHNGILDKYIGDAIMALFGVPFNAPEDADNAVQVAIEMMTELGVLNARRAERGGDAIDIGLGIATGEVVVGNIGSPKRMEYTVIGDSVNLAARLEGATKFYGVKILLSANTVAELTYQTPMREIDLLRVKGKVQPVTIYEALGFHDESSFPGLQGFLNDYAEGLRLYRQQSWLDAQQCFEDLLTRRAHDKPSQLYRERAQHYAENPPGPEWDGIWTMTEK